jgi:hypothetical protein
VRFSVPLQRRLSIGANPSTDLPCQPSAWSRCGKDVSSVKRQRHGPSSCHLLLGWRCRRVVSAAAAMITTPVRCDAHHRFMHRARCARDHASTGEAQPASPATSVTAALDDELGGEAKHTPLERFPT